MLDVVVLMKCFFGFFLVWFSRDFVLSFCVVRKEIVGLLLQLVRNEPPMRNLPEPHPILRAQPTVPHRHVIRKHTPRMLSVGEDGRVVRCVGVLVDHPLTVFVLVFVCLDIALRAVHANARIVFIDQLALALFIALALPAIQRSSFGVRSIQGIARTVLALIEVSDGSIANALRHDGLAQVRRRDRHGIALVRHGAGADAAHGAGDHIEQR
ncbi:hypothetical protein D9M72_356390 [compost metagenome]